MKKKFMLYILSALLSSTFAAVAFAKSIPDYYQNIPAYNFTPRKAFEYEAGDIYSAKAGYGDIYFLVGEDGYSSLCTPDGELLSYDEVRHYFGFDIAEEPHYTNQNQEKESDEIPQTESRKEESKVTEDTRNVAPELNSIGDPNLGRLLGDISMGNHPLAPYYGSEIIVPRPAASQYPPVSKTGEYVHLSDIQGHWAEDYIKRFAAAGYISGYPDGTFHPDDPITYAEFARVVASFDLKPVRWQGGFLSNKLFRFISLTKESEWYYNSCMVASEAGIFGNLSKIEMDNGTEWNEQTAYYIQGITEKAQRQYIALFLANMLEYQSGDLGANLFFTDESKINRYSDAVIYDAMKRLVSQDILNGYPDGSIRPEGTVTRAELVVMLTKILDKYHWDMDIISNNLYGNYNLYFWEQNKILFELVNEERKKAGVTLLKFDSDLQAIAEIRVIEKTLYGYESGGGAHKSQFYGHKAQEIAESFGYKGYVGENALSFHGNAVAAHDSWRRSDAHKENFMNEFYNDFGCAIGERCAYEVFSWK